jgi:hypothetical protein
LDALSSLLGRKLTEAINLRRSEYLRPLIAGQATDYPDYKSRTGYLKALADVERMIEEIRVEEDRRVHGALGAGEAGPYDRP